MGIQTKADWNKRILGVKELRSLLVGLKSNTTLNGYALWEERVF